MFKIPPQIPGRKSVDGVGSDGVGHAKHAREDSRDVSPGFRFNKCRLNRRKLSPDEFSKRLSFHIFHADKGLALRFAHLVNRTDVWMVEGCRRGRFPMESSQPGFIPGIFRRKNLEGDFAL
jgi:hypothetical protein